MKIAIGCDHGGYELKEKLVEFLKNNNHEVVDFGTYSLDSIDYPDYAVKVARGVSNKEFDRGVVVCSTGIGVSIVANKVRNIRCALVHDLKTAKLTREHNDSNVIAFGAKIIDESLAKEILNVWLNTEFEGGRHIRRVNKISMIEGSYKVNVINNPLLNQMVMNLRDKKTSQKEFKNTVNKIGALMSFEISKSFEEESVEVTTPIDNALCSKIKKDIVIIPILRAGLELAEGLYSMLDNAAVGHIGLYRNESTLDAIEYYKNIPNLNNKTVIIADPMLATGGSAIKAISILKENGATDIKYVGIIGSNQGVEALINAHDDVNVYLAACDEKLNEKGYIVPGLGDCGDRIYGTK